MKTTTYNSVPPNKILTLAEASWREFSRFLSRYQWAFDSPSYSPRKTQIASAILNRGQPGACTFFRDGHKYILPVLHRRHFDQAVTRQRKLYYVSYGRHALLYFDIDLHQQWQTEQEGLKVQRLLEALTTWFCGQSVLFWNESSRGVNGYLKTDLQGMDYADANHVFTHLEKDVQRFLAYCANLADFEIKGQVGFLDGDETYHWKPYGKLPIHAPNWNFARLEEFKSKPVVPIRRLEVLCHKIEAQIPQDVLDRH